MTSTPAPVMFQAGAVQLAADALSTVAGTDSSYVSLANMHRAGPASPSPCSSALGQRPCPTDSLLQSVECRRSHREVDERASTLWSCCRQGAPHSHTLRGSLWHSHHHGSCVSETGASAGLVCESTSGCTAGKPAHHCLSCSLCPGRPALASHRLLRPAATGCTRQSTAPACQPVPAVPPRFSLQLGWRCTRRGPNLPGSRSWLASHLVGPAAAQQPRCCSPLGSQRPASQNSLGAQPSETKPGLRGLCTHASRRPEQLLHRRPAQERAAGLPVGQAVSRQRDLHRDLHIGRPRRWAGCQRRWEGSSHQDRISGCPATQASAGSGRKGCLHSFAQNQCAGPPACV